MSKPKHTFPVSTRGVFKPGVGTTITRENIRLSTLTEKRALTSGEIAATFPVRGTHFRDDAGNLVLSHRHAVRAYNLTKGK